MNITRLTGCAPEPLAHYLKALGVLRLVGAQLDAAAKGAFDGEAFTLHSDADGDALVRFFTQTYQPTAALAPWNGGSGFFPKDNSDALNAIEGSPSERFASFRAAITAAREALRALNLSEKASKDDKAQLLELCRGRLPDEALAWLDAAFVLTGDGPKYPPLLGTGGNDGRLEFTNNFMQRLLDVIDAETGAPTEASEGWLRAALFGEITEGLQRGNPIGQFFPGAAGGANSSASFDGQAVINPWDFILMIEGAMTFAASSVRRLGSSGPGALSFPFTVRPLAAGYGSAAQADAEDARAEMWLPLWSTPATAQTLAALMAEGRVQVGRRAAIDGLDFARAVASLGVDRGIDAFTRVGFQMRNGRNYFATPLGRWAVRQHPKAALLTDLEATRRPWLGRFREEAHADLAPAAIQRAAGQLERAILSLCQTGDAPSIEAVLIALGHCERLMAQRRRWVEDTKLSPVPPLSPAWLNAVDTRSAEMRLALALASSCARVGNGGEALPLRAFMEPCAVSGPQGKRQASFIDGGERRVVWGHANLITSMGAVLQRQAMEAGRTGGDVQSRGRLDVSLQDIAAFIAGEVDDARIEALVWGCILIDWPRVSPRPLPAPPGPKPGPLYAAMKLCHLEHTDDDRPLTTGAAALRLALLGDGPRAGELALRRLRVSGHPPRVKAVTATGEEARRSAAALLIPTDGHPELRARLIKKEERS